MKKYSHNNAFMLAYYNFIDDISPLGEYRIPKFLAINLGITVIIYSCLSWLFATNFQLLIPIVYLVSCYFIFGSISKRKYKMFNDEFSDVVNMLGGAISAGETLFNGMNYVGKSKNGAVANEFYKISSRVALGEDIEKIFSSSAKTFPYIPYLFFLISLKANILRGGELRKALGNLGEIMFEAKAVEQKKSTLTAEARMSAQIVAALPVLFLFLLKFISPENFNFVMYEQAGRPILIYVICSEILGIGMIWQLLRGVK